MIHRVLPCALAAAVLVTTACSIPITTPENSISVPYSTFVPPVAQGIPIVTGLPEFTDRQAPPVTFPTPAEAKKVKLETVTLHLRMKNSGPLPIRVKIFLSKHPQDPYATAALGGDQALIEVPRDGGLAEKSFPIDPQILLGDQMTLGYLFGSPGTKESVTFRETDKVEVTYKTSVSAKLF